MSLLKSLYNKLKDNSDKNFQRIDLNHNSTLNDCDWLNHIYISPSIRYGHLEYFKGSNDKVEVVHCVFYPSYFKALPIFGYDVISLGGKITGIFCDYTPCPFHNMILHSAISRVNSDLKHLHRELPGWTDFFSPEFIAISPENEYEKAEFLCSSLFELFVKYSQIVDTNNMFLGNEEVTAHIKGQNEYSLGQRKNSKTQKALAKYIGEEESIKFIENVLFPAYQQVTNI